MNAGRPIALMLLVLACAPVNARAASGVVEKHAAAVAPAAPSRDVRGAHAASHSKELLKHADTSAGAADASLENKAIRRGHAEAPADTATISKPQGLELPRVAAALGIVIALILLLRWGGQKLSRQPRAARATGAIRLLGSAPLSTSRQQIVLVKVGGRVLVLGDSGTQMQTLCQITEANEVAAIVGQISDERVERSGLSFGSLFRRAERQIAGEQSQEIGTDSLGEEMPDPSDAETAAVLERASVVETRDDISGLMDRIRSVSDHFRGA